VTTETFDYVRGRAPGQSPEARSGSSPPEGGDDPLHGELMQLNMGPQHPATHGVLRLVLQLDGETIRSVEPVVGYLHRGKEKTCGVARLGQVLPHTDRLDYVQPLMNNVGYALALERLADLAVPERGQVIRVLLMELSRIAAHLIYLGTTAIDLGAVTMFFKHVQGAREHLHDPRRLHRPPHEQHLRAHRRGVRRRGRGRRGARARVPGAPAGRDRGLGEAALGQPHLVRPQPQRGAS